MEKVEMVRAADGAVFETEAEAKAHEKEVKDFELASAFAAETTDKKGAATRVRNLILAFLAWQAGPDEE